MREPIDPRVVAKIKEMDVMGVRSAAEVRRHLKTFVQNELFHGGNPPSQFSRRYYPTDSDIRNILHASRIGERKAPDDQINLQIKCKEWKESNAEDFIFYRVCKFTLFCNFKLPFNSAPRAKNHKLLLNGVMFFLSSHQQRRIMKGSNSYSSTKLIG